MAKHIYITDDYLTMSMIMTISMTMTMSMTMTISMTMAMTITSTMTTTVGMASLVMTTIVYILNVDFCNLFKQNSTEQENPKR